MANYAIGDVQGCYDALQRLLEYIQFDDKIDRLWFVGDLVNRGPQSLAVLRFVKQLATPPRITLGNHDFYLLYRVFVDPSHLNDDDTLSAILQASDREEIGHWLRNQSILYHDEQLNVVMSHAGIAPVWDLKQAKTLAQELEVELQGENYKKLLKNIYGNYPNKWTDELTGYPRLRVICNYFTRMRFLDIEKRLNFDYKSTIQEAPPTLYPWFSFPNRCEIDADIVFGHWAALLGHCPTPGIYAIDDGCYWGHQLTALRLEDKQRFSVPGFG